MSRATMLMLVLSCSLAQSAVGQAADKRPGAFITMPREGASVGYTSEFAGKTFLRGQPLALVRAIDGNGPWWVQRGIQRNDRGLLKGTIQFGNDLAEPGTRFAFVVVVVQTPLELEFFTKRESLAELPANVPKSEIRSVVLVKPAEEEPADDKPADDKPADDKPGDDKLRPRPGEPPASLANSPPAPSAQDGPPFAAAPRGVADSTPSGDPGRPPIEKPAGDKGRPAQTQFGLAILKPLDSAQVQRIEELVGRMDSEDTPIVLVRPEGPDQQWWVQDKVIFGDGRYFKAKLRFGNEKTPVGTRFIVLVVSPKPGPEAMAMQAGAAFSVLPRGIRRSAEVIVQLADQERYPVQP